MAAIDWTFLAGIGALLAVILLALFWRRGKARPKDKRPLAVIDGSNVMHWLDATPKLQPLVEVLSLLDRRGYLAGVMFDANAGYKLAGRFLSEAALGEALGIGRDRVLVVPKGVQADPYLLDYARQSGAVIVSADRFRDRIADYPELAATGHILRGGYRDGKLWLDQPPGPDQRLAAS